ncbi:hypothetical protein NUW58_g6963 [Xylaria curta]|uniref:Uncharacterized protein n=1 Tax=Xylaria curta TaxID=42375 RepID=A0ACC1NNC5_9PEZI|nr:hypothetical protein NUW58_g6963 [Xylaria curta]
MAEALNLGEQPDFHAMGEHFTGLSAEFGRFPNLAAIQNTDAILAAIGQLTTTINNSVQNLRTEIRTSADNLRTELRADMDNLRTELRAELRADMQTLDYNSRARVLNSIHPTPTLRLHPLKNTTTHEVVPLPETLGALDNLPAADVRFYLEALGQTPEQTATARKVQLKEFIGIKAS